jgi:valyl-tRNA synthetase
VYSRGPGAQIARRHSEAIEKLANVRLAVLAEAAPSQVQGALRSTPEFDLVLGVPVAQAEVQRKRLDKEIEQLEKLIANSGRQLANPEFLARAPEQVVQGIRHKLAEYEAQLEKSCEALAALKG